jgi:polyhydroxybutyrate depolymerase
MWRWLIFLAFLTECGPAAPPQPPPTPPVAPPDAELLSRRPYVPLVPTTYSADAGVAWPLILVLHGYGGSGDEAVKSLRFDDLAPLAVMVAPNGVLDSTRNRAWRAGPTHAPFWDVEYLTAVIHDVERRYAIDSARVFVVGRSQGAHMAHRMACDASKDVAAIVSLAGQVAKVPSACAPARAVSVLQLHGDLDVTIGYYGDVQHDPPDPTVPSARETVGVWGRNNHCTGMLVPTGQTLDMDRLVEGAETAVEGYANCPSGIAAELWTMKGGNHNPDPTFDFAPSLFKFLNDHARK